MLRVGRKAKDHIVTSSAGGGRPPTLEPARRGLSPVRPDPWKALGYPELANTVRRICTLCGWAKDPVGEGQILAITSAVMREGKSTIARAVAIATAQDHAGDVLLLECDLLNPTLAEDFDSEGGPGLSGVLSGGVGLADALCATGLSNLWLLPAGARQDNPSRLLRSPAMMTLLDDVRRHYAFVVIDLPGVLKSSDAAVLARQADGTVLVVRAGATDQRAVDQALQLLTGVTLHGVVLNRGQSKLPDIVRRVVES